MAASSRSGKKKASSSKTLETPEGQAMEKLVQIMLDTFDTWKKTYGIDSERANVFRGYMMNYKKLLKPSDFHFEDHALLFRAIFERYRSQFLGILGSDSDPEDHDPEKFLIDKTIQVWYGEKIASVKKKNYRLPISAIFRKARQFKDELDKTMPSDPELSAEVESSLEYVLAGEFLYRLYDVLFLSLPEDHPNRKEMQKIVQELQEMSGLKNESQGLRDGFGSICEDLYGIARKVGGDDGDGSMPPIQAMGSAMERLFNNKRVLGGIANATSNIAEIFNEDTPPEDAYGRAFDTIAPVLKEAFVDIVKPPPGVEVSPASQAEAERMAQRFDGIVGGISNVMRKINPDDIVEGVSEMTSGFQASETPEAE